MSNPPLRSASGPAAPDTAADRQPVMILSEAEVQERVTVLADLLSLYVKPGCIGVCLLTGGIWFAADLTRALARIGRPIAFDALWLSSYGDNREPGSMLIRARLQRSVEGRQVLILDDVLDTGASLKIAGDIARDAGAAEVLSVVFARKPDPRRDGRMREIEADFTAWEAPDRFLVGYGLDHGGLYRTLPYIGALD